MNISEDELVELKQMLRTAEVILHVLGKAQ